jgi:DnaJ-class molecular chaperone
MEHKSKLTTFQIVKACPECHGEGDEGSQGNPCGFCGGAGYFRKIKRYKNIENAEEANPFDSVYEYNEDY